MITSRSYIFANDPFLDLVQLNKLRGELFVGMNTMMYHIRMHCAIHYKIIENMYIELSVVHAMAQPLIDGFLSRIKFEMGRIMGCWV